MKERELRGENVLEYVVLFLIVSIFVHRYAKRSIKKMLLVNKCTFHAFVSVSKPLTNPCLFSSFVSMFRVHYICSSC